MDIQCEEIESLAYQGACSDTNLNSARVYQKKSAIVAFVGIPATYGQHWKIHGNVIYCLKCPGNLESVAQGVKTMSSLEKPSRRALVAWGLGSAGLPFVSQALVPMAGGQMKPNEIGARIGSPDGAALPPISSGPAWIREIDGAPGF